MGARDHLPVGERHHRYLLDARVGHLRSPRTSTDAHLVERQRDLSRGADGACLAWREAVYDVGGMDAGVPHGLGLPKKVALASHPLVLPPVCAEEVEVDEAPEGEQLDEDPYGLLLVVLAGHAPTVPIPLQPFHLLLTDRSVPLTQAFQVVGDDRVAVLVCSLGDLAHEPDLGKVLDVQRHREQGVPEHVVDGREIPQMPEVKTDVLAVMRSSDALFKQDAVGRELPVTGSARAPRPVPLLSRPDVAVPLDARRRRGPVVVGLGAGTAFPHRAA